MFLDAMMLQRELSLFKVLMLSLFAFLFLSFGERAFAFQLTPRLPKPCAIPNLDYDFHVSFSGGWGFLFRTEPYELLQVDLLVVR